MLSTLLKHNHASPSIDEQQELFITALEQLATAPSTVYAIERCASQLDDLDIVLKTLNDTPNSLHLPALNNYLQRTTAFRCDIPDDKGAMLVATESLISDTLKQWLEALKSHITRYRKHYQVTAGILGAVTLALFGWRFLFTDITQTRDQLNDEVKKTIVKLMAGVMTQGFLNAPSNFSKLVDTVQTIPDVLRQCLEIKLPTTEIEYTVYTHTISQLFKSKLGIDLNHHDAHPTIQKSVSEKDIKDIYHSTYKAAKDLRSDGQIVIDKLAQLSNSPEIKTPYGRKGYIFINKLVIKYMNLSIQAITVGYRISKIAARQRSKTKKDS